MNRILGIDYGDARLGLALSDPLKIIAKPFKTLNNNDDLLNTSYSYDGLHLNGSGYKVWVDAIRHLLK